MEMFLPSSKQQIISISFKWFGQYISTEISTFHDYYLAEYYKSNNEMKSLGFVYGK